MCKQVYKPSNVVYWSLFYFIYVPQSLYYFMWLVLSFFILLVLQYY